MLHRDSSHRVFLAATSGTLSILFLIIAYYFAGNEVVSVLDGLLQENTLNGEQTQIFSAAGLVSTLLCLLAVFGVFTLFIERILFYRSKINKRSLSKQQLDQIGNNIPGVIIQFSVQHSVLHSVNYCSNKLETYFGTKAEDVIKDFTALKLFDEDKMAFHKQLFEASEKFKSLYFEGRVLINESELRWFRIECTPERDAHNAIIYNGVMIDITAQKEAEEEIMFVNQNAQALGQQLFEVNQILQNKNIHLQQLNKLKSEFLGVAAHDLKNPLNGVAGMAEIMSYMVSDETAFDDIKKAEYADIIDDIRSSADHMLKIITDTLNTEALEHGSLILVQKEQDLNKIMEHVVHLNMHHAKEKGISIKYRTDGSIKGIVDSSKVREVMDNLVNNAVKYSPNGSQICVELSMKSNDHAIFSVKDQGPGISSEDQKKLFGRFQKLSAKPTGGESSTGLGLSIVKTIVELHEGSIRCESELGKGATFIVDIPLHALTENNSEEAEQYLEV